MISEYDIFAVSSNYVLFFSSRLNMFEILFSCDSGSMLL